MADAKMTRESLKLKANDDNDSPVEDGDSESSEIRHIESISVLYFEAVERLKTLTNVSKRFHVEGDLDDIRSRLSVWAGNHGAHRPQKDRLSLDHRLREALELHQEVRDHFTEFIRAVDDGRSFIYSLDRLTINFASLR